MYAPWPNATVQLKATMDRLCRKGLLISIVLLCSALVLTSQGTAASDSVDRSAEYDSIIAKVEEMLGGVAERQKEYIYGALLAFQKNTEFGDNWTKTLASIELDVPWSIQFDSPADAAASLEDAGDQHIALNLQLMFEIIDKSTTAARYLIMEEADVPVAKSDNEVSKKFAVDIQGNVIAWILAHEIAHHLAGNVNARAPTLAKARKWELDADIKAFEILNRSGYSLFLLSRYMQVMEQLERIKLRMGLGNPESLSSHPHWSTRSRELQQYMSSYPPAVHRYVIYSSISYEPELMQVTEITYVLPANDLEHQAMLRVGESISMAAVERQHDKSAVVYIQNAGKVYQNQILDPSDYVTVVRIFIPGGGYIDRFCFRNSITGLAAMDSSGVISSGMVYNPLESVLQALRKTNINRFSKEKAKQLFVDRTRSMHDHYLGFFRGALTPEQYQTRVQQTSAHYDSQLKTTLGQQQFDRINLAFASDLAAIIGGN